MTSLPLEIIQIINAHSTPLDKVMELYERMLASEKEKVEMLKERGRTIRGAHGLEI